MVGEIMQIRLQTVLCLAFAGVLTLSAARASERPYYSSVSDVEVESSIKGNTYDEGSKSLFGKSSSKKCCACETAAPATTTTTTTAPAAPANGRAIKYILDGKPVYEDGAKGDRGECGCAAPAGEVVDLTTIKTPSAPVLTCAEMEIKNAINSLGTSSWREAQEKIVRAGKCAIPVLIDALGQENQIAYNLGGHTKTDLGRAPRQLTIAAVCAELLAEIVGNHSTYSGDLPGLSQKAWQEWWSKNAESVTFGA